MQINHSLDFSPDVGTDIEVLGNASYFVASTPEDDSFDCAGTVGTFGCAFGCAGTLGSFGCCC